MQNKLRVAVCDDDDTARRIIASSIKGAFKGQEVEIKSYASAKILDADLSVHTFDLLLLDIDMPDLDGITFATQLREKNAAVDIIYISNREDKVFRSLLTDPCGFIRKNRFLTDMNEVIDSYLEKRKKRLAAEASCLVVQDRACMRTIPLQKIIYLEGQRKVQLANVEGEQEPLVVHSSMQNLEEKLISKGFLRIHKGYLVNYRYISQIGLNEIRLTSGAELPISRRKVQEIRERYLELMRENELLIF